MQLETLLANIPLHASLQDAYGATHLPIYNTATFDLKRQQKDGRKLYDYSRSDNPTRNALENIFAQAENGLTCCCVNSGIAAINLLFETVTQTFDQVLIEKDCYGGTFRILKILLEKHHIKAHFADFTMPDEVETILNTHPIKLVLCESPTNPSLKIINLKTIAQLCTLYGSLFAVDNSMATFAAQKPLDFGADFSLFSCTKFISGHGSVTAGAIVSKEIKWGEKIAFYANAQGIAQTPFDCYLVSLGLPSLIIRMQKQAQNAKKVAEYLQQQNEIIEVIYPGLLSHPQFELAQQQLSIIPAIISIRLENAVSAEHLVSNCRLLGEKVSFGCADSRIEIPAKLSHATYDDVTKQNNQLDNNLVRLSIGLESADDLIQDIAHALKTIPCAII